MNQSIILQGLSIEDLKQVIKEVITENTTEPEKTPENEFLTRDEVCKLLSLNKTSLWKHTKAGKLKSYGIGNRILYKKCEVLEAVKPIKN
jgi:excisionase family DNA binding protein